MDDKKLKGIIQDFLKTATPQELREFKSLLQSRKKKSPMQAIDPMARTMASQIQEQLGISEKTIHRTAQNVVASLAKQYNPRFTNAEINAIVKEMVPDKKKKTHIPPDMLFTMVRHFVDYSTGRMNDTEMRNFPEGWQKKYWHSFPTQVQTLVASLLKDTLDEDTFWQSLKAILFAPPPTP